jgi:hypothetical protein
LSSATTTATTAIASPVPSNLALAQAHKTRQTVSVVRRQVATW